MSIPYIPFQRDKTDVFSDCIIRTVTYRSIRSFSFWEGLGVRRYNPCMNIQNRLNTLKRILYQSGVNRFSRFIYVAEFEAKGQGCIYVYYQGTQYLLCEEIVKKKKREKIVYAPRLSKIQTRFIAITDGKSTLKWSLMNGRLVISAARSNHWPQTVHAPVVRRFWLVWQIEIYKQIDWLVIWLNVSFTESGADDIE